MVYERFRRVLGWLERGLWGFESDLREVCGDLRGICGGLREV